MIRVIKKYRLTCDGCGQQLEDSLTGKDLFLDEKEIMSAVKYEDWLKYRGKYYCTHCALKYRDLKNNGNETSQH